jgi:hypothetical protein
MYNIFYLRNYNIKSCNKIFALSYTALRNSRGIRIHQ